MIELPDLSLFITYACASVYEWPGLPGHLSFRSLPFPQRKTIDDKACKLGSDVYLFGEIGEKTLKEENKKAMKRKETLR